MLNSSYKYPIFQTFAREKCPSYYVNSTMDCVLQAKVIQLFFISFIHFIVEIHNLHVHPIFEVDETSDHTRSRQTF